MSSLLLIAAQSVHGAAVEDSHTALEAPTWLDFLHRMPWWPEWMPVQFAWSVVAMVFVCLLCYLGTRRMQRVPRGLQNLLETAVQGIEDFVVGVMGPTGRSFTPFLGTLFIYIAVMNLFGLLPGFASPTANLNTTLGMAIIVFFVVQYHGVRQSGWRYVKHFIGEPWWLFFIMLPLHIISELVRPMTLALRLRGNIYGEEVAVFAFIALAVSLPVYLRWLPLQLPMVLLACLTSLIQALVFVLLTSLYLTLASPEAEH
ncbi:MAG: F0F1 ATP synthase subunit A [Armatimonadetes bacterium]|nr:F0F1 ATP synthase subunit A [Armatimonadota bacterium]NIM24085.1 F0F1 ATP synthase subunit A [Armatimonadota bacterium]NIM67939.1 F0F1 ATP synthase subunit A [Armatimonadota bacterium]NIM76461.1 F0F1 ATP synthase subunit A [Armatimonadota bacterium]NIN06169.1 F0F1 ATP synthase subunit A [Armatimonadota bacterium]